MKSTKLVDSLPRLTDGHFERWLELAEVGTSFMLFKDEIIAEPFMATCSSKMKVFLKKRRCTTIDELGKTVHLHLEPQGGS